MPVATLYAVVLTFCIAYKIAHQSDNASKYYHAGGGMHWVFLTLAIACEIIGTMAMKYAEGFSKPLPSLCVFLFYGLALTCITIALKKIDLSVAYTIWAGVGTALIALIGIAYFGEPSPPLKLASIGLVILGVIGLKVSAA